MHIYRDTQERCYLYDVPEVLDFGTVSVSGNPQTISREVADWTIQVLDTDETANWTLTAAITTPMTSTDGQDTLPSALVFVSDGTTTPLSNQAIVIAQKQSPFEPGEIDLVWDEDEGFLLELEGFEGTAGKSYATTIEWTFVIDDD